MNDPVIDLHMLFVSELGRTVRSFLKHHWCHRAVSLRKTLLSFDPGRQCGMCDQQVSDQPAHTGSLIRAFASPFKIL